MSMEIVISVAALIVALVALLVMALDEGILHQLHFSLLWLAEYVFLEQEIVCLISEFLLELHVEFVFAAVEDEFFGITTFHLTQIACDNRTIRIHTGSVILRRSSATVATSTSSAILAATHDHALWIDCSSLIVELVLELESSDVVLLPEASIPVLVDSTREHQHDLRNVSQVVLLALHDANNVLLATFTEAKLLSFVSWYMAHLFLIEFLIQLDKITVFLVFLILECFLGADLAESSEHTSRVVQVFALKRECLERSQILLASLTDDHSVTKGELLASDLVLFDHFSLLCDPLSELFQHVLHELIVEVDLLGNLLNVDRLQKVSLLAVLLVPQLSVFEDLAIFVHVDVFKALTICQQILLVFIQEEVILIICLLVECLKDLTSILSVIFVSECFKFDEDVHGKTIETHEFLQVEIDLTEMGQFLLVFITETLI